MIVYVVLEQIDLGDHIVSIHANKTTADKIAETKNAEYLKLYGVSGKTEWFYVDDHIVEP
jgi:predicted ABC-type sugar transport system permease subunit